MEVEGCVNLNERRSRKKVISIIILLAMLIINLTIITAQPPFEQSGDFTEGYEIKIPNYDTLKQGSNFEFSFHVYNISDGMPVSNVSTTCQVHFYNSTGDHIYINTRVPYSLDLGIPNDWDVIIDGGNFTTIGHYSYLIQCNSSVLGGFESVGFDVTTTGTKPSTGENMLYAFFVFILFAVSIVLIYLIVIIPSENERNEKGVIIGIVKLKYLRILLIGILYPLIIIILNLMNGLAVNIATLSIFSGTFGILFEIMLRGAWPVTIILVVWMVYLLIKDTNIQKGISKLEIFMND